MTLITWMFSSPFSFSSSVSERTAETWGLLILSLRVNVWHFWSSCFMNQHSRSIYWTSIICHTLFWEPRMWWFDRHLSVRGLQSSRGARWYIMEQKCKHMHFQIDALREGNNRMRQKLGKVSFFRWGDGGAKGLLGLSLDTFRGWPCPWARILEEMASLPSLPSHLITVRLLAWGCGFSIKGCRMCTDVKISKDN